MTSLLHLPIEPVIPDLKEALRRQTNAVLVAPPGSGKTTRIPLALLDEPWLAGQRVLMLEPRRLAARAAARYMAASLGEQVGETVGYRVRLDTRVGANTRVEVITEGVLTRLLQADPALEGVGLVIFDEFHERNIHADLGLTMCLQAQAVLRPDLRLLVMSATLDAAPVAALLGDAPVLTGTGAAYPVETRYLDRPVEEGRRETVIVDTIIEALTAAPGDILVFLPGAAEIRRVEAAIAARGLGANVRVAPLYGMLPLAAQDLAIAPSPPGQRKVVLATSIAETSLTVEGVRTVIDSGLMRVSRFSPRTGMTRLETAMVSRAVADQRRGRAGRLAPGVCYRLWTKQEDARLAPRNTPEILEADLAPLALELAVWGVADPAELSWLDPPPAAAFAQARELLQRLGALGRDGAVTPHGRRMAAMGLHPRLAHMVLRAIPLGLGGLACELAVLLSERDILRSSGGASDADLRLRVEALRLAGQAERDNPAHMVDWAAVRRLRAELDYLRRLFGIAGQEAGDTNACGLLLAFAYPDRIGQRRENGRFLLASGRGAAVAGMQALADAPYLVAAELDDQGTESRILLAAPVDFATLKQHFADQIEETVTVVWDRAAQAVRARKYERLGALILREVPVADPAPEDVLAALLAGIAEAGLDILPWTRAASQLRQRINFMHRLEPGWPDMSDEALIETLDSWLGPYLYGISGRDGLARLNLVTIIESTLTWDQRRELDECAPTHIVVPSGQRIPVDYSDPAAPVLAVRLQEMFGLTETPRIARGRVPLTLHLLSPAHRPVQVTRDLASFWRGAYFEVRKDLLGRYPKHYWPDDPLAATPTHRVRPRT
ncbi:ATP-dependent helicase HrpB [Thermosinus carboxydivorans]|uniref:ATP-dependent helicase HrpB n=1 Tax=Thermosinus carboxydivorans TaxID=261685 RepID=UPI001E4DA995|nr:ATP-dependent helicase HrpB [Thermosinus carboxydivorans]